MIQTKRIYEDAEESDGYRVLVDRLWPRGIKKVDAGLDAWDKDLAPSNDLRKAFHASGDYEDFRRKYIQEIENNPEAEKDCQDLIKRAQSGTVTLLYGSKDKAHNNAKALESYLNDLSKDQ